MFERIDYYVLRIDGDYAYLKQIEDESVEETLSTYRVVSPDTIMINGLNLNYDFITQRVAIVKEKGIMSGMGNNMFAPNANVTRAQAAKAIYEFIRRG